MRDGRLLNKKSRGANAIMSSTYGTAGQEARSEAASSTPGTPDRALTVRAGLIGGLAGGDNHLDLRSPCLGRGAASDAIGGHSTQRDGPGIRQAGAGAA